MEELLSETQRVRRCAEATEASLLCVLVAYQRTVDAIGSWSYLSRTLSELDQSSNAQSKYPGLALEGLIIYDNSSESRAKPPRGIPRCEYVHNPGNGGTAAAYVFAGEAARERGVKWLLLLDQDTVLPADFFSVARRAINSNPAATAIVPWVTHAGNIVSPARVSRLGTIIPLDRTETYCGVSLTAIASGAILDVGTLISCFPFPSGLWLDYVDHWIFLRFRSAGGLVVVSEIQIDHDLSVVNLDSLTERRLLSILDGELEYASMLGRLARIVYPVRIVWRLVRYAFKTPSLAAVMLRWMLRRFVAHEK